MRIGEQVAPARHDDAGDATDPAPADAPEPGRSRRSPWLIVALVVAAGLGGAAIAVALSGPTQPAAAPDPSPPAAPESADDGAGPPPAAVPEGLEPAPTQVPPAPAEDPQAAVEGFLVAEANSELEASYDFLAAEQRESFGSPAVWVADHADVMPPVIAFEIDEVTTEGGQAEVTSLVAFEPGLDQVVGLVPGQARVTWTVIESDGTWGVSLDQSTMEPIHPPEAAAADAVAAWARSRQACQPEGEWGGTLVGVPRLAEQLCDAPGEVGVGAVTTLDQLDQSTFVTAFGADVVEWARVVPLTSPVPQRVVVAPVGEQWQVIGTIPTRAGPGG